MRVYRLETCDGGGPYNGAARSMLQDTDTWEGMFQWHCPSPWEDMPSDWHDMRREVRKDYLFGFTSMAQLQRWFTADVRETLRNIGFWLASYEVDDCHIVRGGNQLAFNSTRATLVNRVSL